jgi:predicted DNA-binding protein YlxM (UPF0122 family)
MSKELVKYSELLIIYKWLFTKKQQAYLNDYFINDMSFNEVAKKNHVSSMAIHDSINRCKKQLSDYENKLHLYSKQQKRDCIYKKIKDIKLRKLLLSLD